MKDLQGWRLAVVRYEQRIYKTMHDNVKVSALLESAPDGISKRLKLDADRDTLTANELLARHTSYCQMNTNFSPIKAKDDGDDGGLAPMGIGGVKGGGGKGGGKGDSKGKGKGGAAKPAAKPASGADTKGRRLTITGLSAPARPGGPIKRP